MMTPETKAATASTATSTTTATSTATTMAHTQQKPTVTQLSTFSKATTATATTTTTSTTATPAPAPATAKAAKSIVSNANSNSKNNSSNNNNNNNNNNNASKKLSLSRKADIIAAAAAATATTKSVTLSTPATVTTTTTTTTAATPLTIKSKETSVDEIAIKSENTRKTTTTTTTTTATVLGTTTTSAVNGKGGNHIKKESTPPATRITNANVAAEESATTSSASSSSSSSSSSSASSHSSSSSTISEDASSIGGASADEEASVNQTETEAEPPTTTTTTSAAATTPHPVLLTAVNPHIICHLCKGYLINATTIVECLHSFCHSCLIRHLRKERYCPRCEMVINNAKPNIKSDTTLQAIVYKLVPGLYERELMRKRAFYKDRPQEAALATPEQRGDDTEHLIFSPSDDMSLSLEYAELGELNAESELEFGDTLRPRHLKCPAMFRVSHMKKYVYEKFQIDAQRFSIDIMYKVKTIVLLDYYTLMDVAYIYTWKRDAPMRFYFRVYESPQAMPPPPALASRRVLPLKREKREISPAAAAAAAALQPPSTATTLAPAIKAQTPPPPALLPPTLPTPPSPSPSSQKALTPVTPTVNPSAASAPRIKQEKQEEFRIASKQLASPTEPLKLVINRNMLEKHDKNYSPSSSSKTSSKSTPPPSSPKEEPNIKLKIDLSKQNSVTIINMSDPDRKEIVKPLKPEKESRSKSKKDKDGSPKTSPSSSSSSSSSNGERKRKSPSPLTVPPLTIRTERILSPNGVSTLSPRVTSGGISTLPPCPEDPKSAFLKSFALTPIKVKVESPEKMLATPPLTPPAKISKINVDDSMLMKPPSSMPPKSIASSKRKSKEPVKAVSKKPKLSPPLPREDFKIRLPGSTNQLPIPNNDDKPLMPPPMKPPMIAPRKQQAVGQFAVPPSSPLYQGMQMSAPGNRTPIAKRYQPILPKAARPNPFANIPNDVNRLLKDAGTEIKSIGNSNSSPKPHVYGPKTETKMGPPPAPPRHLANGGIGKTTNNNNSSNNHQGGATSSTASGSNKSNNYLNLALFNASKSKGKEAPPGCRTPMYTPNSPIYSPSSPQYVPNYNIPTMPTYKYTPKPSTQASNYLQNILGTGGAGGNGGGLSAGLFPSPPTKADQNTNPVNATSNSYQRSASPNEDAPEKQQVKVKSLLNSCNINIPSSLSITISRDNGDPSSANNGAHPKHKSPVNNYIEIVKLPDQTPNSNAETQKRLSPPAPPISTSAPTAAAVPVMKLPQPHPPTKTIPSPQHLMSRLTPPQLPPTSAPTPPRVITPPKTSPTSNNGTNATIKAAAAGATTAPPPPMKPVLTPTQADKKTPSPEKRSANHSPTASENKSPKSATATNNGGGDPAAKKFRPILPRQNALPELAPKLPNSQQQHLNNANNNAAKGKVQPSKKSPNGGNPNLPGSLAQKMSPPAQRPLVNAKKSAKNPTPPPQHPTPTQSSSSSSSSSSSHVASPMNKLMPHPGLTPLSIASSAAAAGQLDLSNFLKENLIRAQAAQVAAANQSNLLYNFAQIGHISPAMYQQAYFMEHLSRIQRAGNEVFNDYLQKLKSAAGSNGNGGNDDYKPPVMPMLPTVTLPSISNPTAAASPKTSPLPTGKLTAAATPALAMGKNNAASPRQQTAATSNGNRPPTPHATTPAPATATVTAAAAAAKSK